MLKDQSTKYNLIYICYDYTKKLKLYKLTNKYKKIILNKFPNVKFVKFNSKNKILLRELKSIKVIFLVKLILIILYNLHRNDLKMHYTSFLLSYFH